MTFGCPPTGGVLAKSKLAENYIDCVKKHLINNARVWQIPQWFQFFKRDYDKYISHRDDLSQELYFDTALNKAVVTHKPVVKQLKFVERLTEQYNIKYFNRGNQDRQLP